MKITLMLLSAALATLSLAASNDLPADVQRLVDARDREAARINGRFTRDLENLRDRYERGGNEKAVTQIDSMFGTGKFALEGEWSFTIDGRRDPNPVVFGNEGNATSPSGHKGIVSLRGNKLVIIQWPGRLWHAYVIDPQNPRRMVGVSSDQRHLQAEKLD